uniref:Uncharacterized protein n=1 Tax=Chenopodium quinoa TaxID=63459 RepID=A0A803MKZ5_CHEQI
SDSDGKRLKSTGSEDENHKQKANNETASGKGGEQKSKPVSDPSKDYIHVRARRGQASDSHSLAERVIGKALVLDEIINYMQSLQRQVEFLSMKLEAVNTRTSPSIEGFPSKDCRSRTAVSVQTEDTQQPEHLATHCMQQNRQAEAETS